MADVRSNENETTKDEEKEFQWYLKSAEEGDSNRQYYLGYCYMNGIGTIKDEEKAFQWYLKSAEGGNNIAMLNLGNCYSNEIGTTKDEEKAFQWYLKTAEGGNCDGQFILGVCYENGIGTTKDEERAFQWYLKSAEGGNNNEYGQYYLGYCYMNGIGTIKDERKAFQWYLKSAEGGNSDAMLNLGNCYLNEIGTTKNEGKAFLCYLKSAEGGNSDGLYNLGNCYYNGIGITKDEGKAFQWYLKSAEEGNSNGQYNLGYCYMNGIGTTKDEVKAFQWYFKSAKGGDSDGQNKLGYCYMNGIGITKDEKKAFQWYLKSAEEGNSDGQFNLGNHYQNGIGTIKDETKAFQWYLKSAEGGNSNGQHNLGYCYQNGIGTIKDEKKAFQWYLKSGEGGNSNAMLNLGNCYLKEIGTTKDEEKAFQWYLKTAEGGNCNGQFVLGVCYEKGIGTTKDEEKAFQWYLKSAEEGCSDGQFGLGNCYMNGIGTAKDGKKALMWISLSAEGGNDSSQRFIEFSYRDEFEISTIKKYQNKIKQSTNIMDNNFTPSKSSIKNLKSIGDLNVKNHNCSICWQKNGCIEICKEYFQDFGRCHNCGNLNIRKNICKNCKSIELTYMKIFSRNVNDIVNFLIQMTELDEKADEWEIWRWIDYSKLKRIQYLDQGGFGTVWKAEWIDMSEELLEIYNFNQVALKKLTNSKEMSFKFLEELAANFQCRSKFVLPILGITQDPSTMEYALVLRYMKNGNLRNFLQQNKTLLWTERLWLLYSFISGLDVIHGKGYIHRDLHPGNLMITEAHDDLKFIRLGDLGICRHANQIPSSGRYGVLPYIAPEVINKNPYTQASDIYSVGIIMWVISTGKVPFSDRAYDLELALEILEGLRPNIKKSTPQCYVKLMKNCWHKDPSKRPSTRTIIFSILKEWLVDLICRKKTENSLMFLKADQEIQNEDFELSSIGTIHSKASLISKPLPLPPLQISNLDLSNIDWNDF
ncbi:hypothetical protein Glove_624g37 [Diversispora epigaea]|uniref:Protein kinase domain-containing protein n=1 Tax=Diversispora epigaea TaxID=1348612 RepID=A0A397G9Q8_9GLOM|nr:hypothetical protein Glove_624g37 [Diversispora epigaea]